jgi:hypothetical protein
MFCTLEPARSFSPAQRAGTPPAGQLPGTAALLFTSRAVELAADYGGDSVAGMTVP